MRTFLFWALAISILTSCEDRINGNGTIKKETRETAPFSKLEINGSYDVQIVPANYSSLTVVADENLLPHIESYVKDGKLHVSSKKKFGRYRQLSLQLTMKDFKGIEASGATKIKSKGSLKGDQIELDFDGAVEAFLEINADKLKGDFSGASELNLRGNVNEMELEISGATEINAEELKSRTCRLEMSGAGEAVVYVTEKLDIDVSGAGNVRYRGNPAEVKQNISGAASIKPLSK
ncbi:MAG: head GIN domain-containing protein [Owenweeksia sp.]|nr:head GIN domain-containing protein [Owenweeksia sp.]